MRNRFASLFGAEVRIGAARRSLNVVRHGAFAKNGAVLLNTVLDEDLSPQALGQHCRTVLTEAACAGLPLSITLSDELVRLFMVTPPQNAARLQDLSAAASVRFQSLYGEPPREWRLSADWRTGKPFLACAVPRELMEQCGNLADDLRMPLVSLRPHFVSAWNISRSELSRAKDHAWLAVLRGSSLSLGIVTPKPHQHLCAVRGLTVPDGKAGLDWLQEQVARAAIQAGVAAPDLLLLAGDDRTEWADIQDVKLKVRHLVEDAMTGERRPQTTSLPPYSPAKAASA